MGPEEHEHSYEELREVVINVLLDARRNGVDRFEKLVDRTCLELGDRGCEPPVPDASTALHPNDAELILEIVWDLFRQGALTLGLDLANPGWPWLRLSRFGECALQHGAYRFHNKAAFMQALRSESIDVSRDAIVYLREAIAAFYTDCLLAACVMLGIAAESEFLRVLEAAKKSRTYGQYFSRIGDGLPVQAKALRFREAVTAALSRQPEPASRDLDDALIAFHGFLRSGRNEAGQTSSAPSRDQVFVYLQLFIPFAEQLTRLRRTLTEGDYPRLVQAP
jgi:hypothetical protein